MEFAQALEILEMWRHHSLSSNTNFGNSGRSSLFPAKKKNDYIHNNKSSRICAIFSSSVMTVLVTSNEELLLMS